MTGEIQIIIGRNEGADHLHGQPTDASILTSFNKIRNGVNGVLTANSQTKTLLYTKNVPTHS